MSINNNNSCFVVCLVFLFPLHKSSSSAPCHFYLVSAKQNDLVYIVHEGKNSSAGGLHFHPGV